MAKYVYDFSEGGMEMNDLLGGKGANLAEMAKLGLPVPPGFTITTEACRYYLAGSTLPGGLDAEVEEHLAGLEAAGGRRLGDPDDPLLVSVRSGARFSMPGMMDTVLDLGLNDQSVLGLAKQSGSERFAWDSYRRFVSMFASTVLGVPAQLFSGALDRLKARRTAGSDLELDAEDLSSLTREFLSIVLAETGRPFPSDPRRQLSEAILAVFGSWKGERARLYRRLQHIADDLGTAVNVVTMVYGNLGMHSGTGVAFTRDPSTGRGGVYGDYLPDAQGEDVVAGIRNTMSLQDLEELNPTAYAGLLEAMSTLEAHYRDLCDIEFTIEHSKLFILQTRVGKRTPAAAFRIACQLVDEGTIDLDEALRRVDGHGLATLMFPSFDESATAARLTTGTPASPGAAVGKVALDSATAVRGADDGDQVILVRRETNPDDLAGMVAAEGILTSRGGKTSHAAVVARGMGKTCVVAAEDLSIDLATRSLHFPSGTVVAEGEVISIDGATGAVYLGAVPVVASPVVRFFDGSLPESEHDDLVTAVERLLFHADSRRRLSVRANADTPADAARARRFGAEGIGLCRTEHMFLGERRKAIEQLILADSPQAQQEALDQLLPLQRGDFVEMLEAMDGLPVTVRLIDPPLHEFLPDLTELSVRVALARLQHAESADDERLLAAVRRLHEQNPMLGLRGVRLGIMIPGLVALQVRALAEAAAQRIKDGGHPIIEVMVPVVDSAHEVEVVREEAGAVLTSVEREQGVQLTHLIGTMIELPRACLTAGHIAESADFFSFGTNDLTQTTWGFSRDDCEASFFHRYLERGIFAVSPFETIDERGVGRLVELAVTEGRAARPGLEIGVCGEHGGDPDSIQFFHKVGLDYVSCSPFRLPVARLEAGRAAVGSAGSDSV